MSVTIQFIFSQDTWFGFIN